MSQLEQKLDGIVHLLTSKESQTASHPSPDSLTKRSTDQSPEISACRNRLPDAPQPVTYVESTLGHEDDLGPSFQYLGNDEAQSYLDTYRSDMIPNFPFVIIPPDVSVETLRQTRPALFGAVVVAASSPSMQKHIRFGEDLLKYLMIKLLIKGDKSVELLQALLVYTAWFDFQ